MDAITLSILLEYLYKKFVVTFILCLIGGVIRETTNTIKMNVIYMRKTLGSVILSSILLCALMDYIQLPFSIYAVICIICGLWSQSILALATNNRFMLRLLKGFASGVKDPVAKGVANAISDMEENSNNTNAETKLDNNTNNG